jgi:hypothetical protein
MERSYMIDFPRFRSWDGFGCGRKNRHR